MADPPVKFLSKIFLQPTYLRSVAWKHWGADRPSILWEFSTNKEITKRTVDFSQQKKSHTPTWRFVIATFFKRGMVITKITPENGSSDLTKRIAEKSNGFLGGSMGESDWSKWKNIQLLWKNHESHEKKRPYFPWNTGCLMTGSIFHGLWNNPEI